MERKPDSNSPGCLIALGAILGCAISFVLNLYLSFHGFGLSYRPDHELQLVMETYYFGDGLAELTGDTSILELVVTEDILQRTEDFCNKGLCDGNRPPHVIGDYFRVLRQTDEIAIVELEDRPLLPDAHRGYLKTCYLLERDGGDWRVSGGYLDCDRYLPEKYK